MAKSFANVGILQIQFIYCFSIEMSQPEIPTKIPAQRSGNFSSVTKIGNEAVAALSKVLDSDTDTIIKTLRSVMPQVLQMAVEVTFERAKFWPLVDTNQDLRFYSELKYDKWMNPDDPNASELKQATVSHALLAIIRSITSLSRK